MTDDVQQIRALALAEAQANLTAPTTTTKVRREDRKPQPTTPKTPAYVPPVNPNSIRQTVRTMLLAGSDTKTISAVLAERFPESAAAKKSVIHIAYYRAELRKAGLLAKKGQ